jgi:hypothetical protein
VLSSLPHFFRLIKDLKLDVQYHIEQALLWASISSYLYKSISFIV